MKKFLSDVLVDCDLTVSGSTSLGTATGITVVTSDNSTNLATTAWVKSQGYITTNTTYDISVPVGTTKIRLTSSDGVNDDITISAAGASTVSRVSDSEIRITSVDSVDYISNVALNGNSLDFNGTGNAFAGSIDLSTITTSFEATDVETVYARVKNVSGGTLLKGTPLAVVTGQTSGIISDVVAADASDPDLMPAVYILNEDIADEAEGEAIIYGKITGIDTSLFDSGDTVYVAPGGGWTTTKPIHPNLIQNLGVITKSHSSNGGGEVMGAGRSNDLPNLTAGKIWVGTTNYPIESTTVHIDETNNRVGIGTTSPSSLLEISGGGTTTDFLKLTTTNGQASPVKLIFEKSATEQGIIEFNRNGDLEIYNTDNDGGVMINGRNSADGDLYVNNSGNVGIGTTSPTEKLHVFGDVRVQTTTPANTAGTATIEFNPEYSTQAYIQSVSNFNPTSPTVYSAGFKFIVKNRDASLPTPYYSIDAMSINANGNVGIGTTSPISKLHIIAPAFTQQNDYSGLYLSIDSSNVGQGNYGPGIIFGGTSTSNTGVNQDGAAIFGYQYSSDADSVGLGFAVRGDSNDTARSIAAVLKGGTGGSSDIYLGVGTDDPQYNFDLVGDARIQGTVIPDDGFENDFMYFGRVPSLQATWTNGGVVLLFHINTSDSGNDNFCDGKYYVRRSTSLLNAYSIDIHLNTNDNGGVNGGISINNINGDTDDIQVVDVTYNGERFAALKFTGDLVRDGSYFYGMVNTSHTTKFQALNIDDVTVNSVISNFTDGSLGNSVNVSYQDFDVFRQVGIGTIFPTEKLHVDGNVLIENNLHVKGDLTIGKISNDSALVDVGGNFNFDTVAEPSSTDVANFVATVQNTSGNVNNGDHTYTVIYKTADGGETGSYTSSFFKTITITDNTVAGQVLLTGIPISTDERVVARDIYRTSANDSTFYGKKLATLNDNTTTTFTDNLADSSLDQNTLFYRKANTTAGVFYINNDVIAQAPNWHRTSFGLGALSSNTIGQDNVAVGGQSLSATTTGKQNTAIGYASGVSNIDGENNTYLGYASGYYNDSGDWNTYVGSFAGRNADISSTNYNTGVGAGSLYKLTANNSWNTALGYYSGNGAQGQWNIHLGFYAGYKATPTAIGSFNINLGAYTGQDTTGNNNILIGREIEAPSLSGNDQLNIGNLIYGTALGSGTNISTGNLGIGTISPSEKLTVAGNIRVANSGKLYLWNDHDANYLDYRTWLASSSAGLTIKNAAGHIKLIAGSTEVLRAESSGNVGIGTTNPSMKLDVVGGVKSSIGFQAYITESSDADNIFSNGLKYGMIYNGSANLPVPGNSHYANLGNIAITHYDSASANDFYIRSKSFNGNTSWGKIWTDQNFTPADYIPTTDYNDFVNVAGDTMTGNLLPGTDSTLRLGNSTNRWLQVHTRGVTSEGNTLDLRGSAIKLYNGANTAMTINSSGDIGIGTTSPSTKLHIEDTTAFITVRGIDASYSNAGIQLISGNATNNRALGVFHYVENSDVEWFAGLPYSGNDAYVINRNTGYTVPSSQSSPPGIGASAGRLLTINSSGNVGIGADNPSYKLQVNGTARFGDGSPYLKVTSSSVEVEGSYLFAAYQSGVSFYAYDSVFRGLVKSDSSGGNALKLGDTTERMRIVGGNVGIGTTSPADKLHVDGGRIRVSNVNGLYIDSSAVYGGNAGATFSIVNDSSSNPVLRILNANAGGWANTSINSYGGNVGIGTLNPGANLDVAGSIPVIRLTDTRNLNVGDWDDVSLGKIEFYTSDTTSPGARALAEIEAYSGVNAASGPEAELRFKTSTITDSSPVQRMVIDAQGRIGIGVADPTDSFQIHDSTTTSNPKITIYGYDTATTSAKYGSLHIATDGSFIIGAQDTYLQLSAANYIQSNSVHYFTQGILQSNNKGFSVQESGGSFKSIMNVTTGNLVTLGGVGSSWSTGGDVALFTAGSEKVRIDTSGNVGIGTTAPSEKLHVVGNIAVTGTVDGRDISKGFPVISSSAGYLMGSNLDPDNTQGVVIGRATGPNQPPGFFQDGALISLSNNDINSVAQMWVGMFGDRGRLYIRNKDGGGWQNWIKIINENDLTSYSLTTHTHDASDIVTGTLDGGVLPWIDNDTFIGTYPIVWSATDFLYRSSWLQVRGSDDTLLTRNISANGSISASSNITLTGYIELDQGTTLDNGSGDGQPAGTIIETLDSNVYIGAFLDFTVYNDTKEHMRSGTLQVAFNGTQVTYNEVNTIDIGDTSLCTLSAVNNAGTVEVLFTAPDPTFHIKYHLRTL